MIKTGFAPLLTVFRCTARNGLKLFGRWIIFFLRKLPERRKYWQCSKK